MSIGVASVDYRAVPLEVLNTIIPDEHGVADLVRRARRVAGEAFVLATCNRVELYGFARGARDLGSDLADILSGSRAIVAPSVHALGRKAATIRQGRHAVRHLLRVASGLESVLLAENEIVAQVRATLADAQRQRSIGPMLSRLLMQSLRTQKRVRGDAARKGLTRISTASAALRGAAAVCDLSEQSIMVLGAGRLAREVLWLLSLRPPREVTVVNRTAAHADTLARRFGAKAVAWDQRQLAAQQANVVIACIPGGPGATPALTATELDQARRHTTGPLLALDLGVPPALHSAVGRLPNVRLMSLAEIQSTSSGLDDPAASLRHRDDRLIEHGVEEYISWYRARGAAPIVAALSAIGADVRDREVAHALRRLPGLNDRERHVVECLATRIVGKLLHAPMAAVKSASVNRGNRAAK